jgi:hypothetical protein
MGLCFINRQVEERFRLETFLGNFPRKYDTK